MTIAGHAAMRFWLRPGGLATTTTTRGYSVFLKWQGGGLIGLSTKTLRSVAPSSTWAASYLHPSSAAFITTIAESSFQYTQVVDTGTGDVSLLSHHSIYDCGTHEACRLNQPDVLQWQLVHRL